MIGQQPNKTDGKLRDRSLSRLASARLGYGTSTLMGRLSVRDSLRALETAFDHGITHFDTARMYGYGEAESVVGRFMHNKRDKLTLTTKAGILPPRRSPALSLLRSVARGMVAVAPSLRSTLRRQAEKTIKSGCFDIASIRSSLELSLRELNTEYIDHFLLHECEPEDLSFDLFELLSAAVSEGKIRTFGIATALESSHRIIAERSEFAAVVQVPHSIVSPAMKSTFHNHKLITHSIFRGDAERIGAQLAPMSSLSSGLSFGAIGRSAMIEFALLSNNNGITLFSSSNPQHIAENSRAISNHLFDPEELLRVASEGKLG